MSSYASGLPLKHSRRSSCKMPHIRYTCTVPFASQVFGDKYPIVLKEPKKELGKLLPLMEVGLLGMFTFNGAAGIARMFGYPVPQAPEWLVNITEQSIDFVKKGSNVAAFSHLHSEAKSTDRPTSNKTVRGDYLLQLQSLLEQEVCT